MLGAYPSESADGQSWVRQSHGSTAPLHEPAPPGNLEQNLQQHKLGEQKEQIMNIQDQRIHAYI